MNEKLSIIGRATIEIRTALQGLCASGIDNGNSLPTDAEPNVRLADRQTNTRKQLKTHGYKTVSVAYIDEFITNTIGNCDLENVCTYKEGV